MSIRRESEEHKGFEIGPIRPPSEAESLLIRITRNCPWNQCKFCALYKGQKFSIRPVEHVLNDIDRVKYYIDEIKKIKENPPEVINRELRKLGSSLSEEEGWAYYSAATWIAGGMKSVFLQDANSMVIKPEDMITILKHITKNFPKVERITSYARSQTIARISDEDLSKMTEAGLNRIHIGMESAADVVLDFIKKGADKKTHIIAGQKVKRAGIELSEYFMPGLGGVTYSKENAIETADAMNQINPDFIRLRTLAIPDKAPLAKDYQEGTFKKMGDIQMVEELLLFIEKLNGITSTMKSDHILNLIPEVEGKLPEDREKIISAIKKFLNLSEEDKIVYMIGRRTGTIKGIYDMDYPSRIAKAKEIVAENNITSENVDSIVAELMKRFI